MIKVGQKKGDFQIKAEIGRGGMGTIYYAVDTMLNREVALKVIHPDLASNVQLMERFKVEAMTQGQMNHPNIVTVFSFNKIDEENVIAMEYVDGKNLKDILREQKVLSISDAIFYLKQILKALEYSHSRNIIHRDIKPANILVDSDNRLKISDFGIAKVFGKQGLTKTGMLLGTPWYTPPEQIVGENIDFRSDLYSVGITFYEMVTGKVPFDSKTNSDFQVQKAHLETPPPRPSIFNPEIGTKIEKFILKALQKKPEKRFQSASEMLSAIREIEKKISETGITRSGIDQYTKIEEDKKIIEKRGHRLLFGSLLVLFVCLAGAAIYFLVLKEKPAAAINNKPVHVTPDIGTITRIPPEKLSSEIKTDNDPDSEKINEVMSKGKREKKEQSGTFSKKKTESTIKKIEKPIKIEPKIPKKKKVVIDKKPEVQTTKNDPDGKSIVLGKELSNANLEAEFIRLKKLVELGEYKKAEGSINELLESGVKSPDLYSIAGKMKFIQGKFPEAEENWKNSVNKGGAVILRFYHKHGFFNKGCSGQIKLKKGLIVFNSVTRRSHSFAVTSDMIIAVKKRKGNFGIEISFNVKGKAKKHVFILRRRSRSGEKFISGFINKHILGEK